MEKKLKEWTCSRSFLCVVWVVVFQFSSDQMIRLANSGNSGSQWKSTRLRAFLLMNAYSFEFFFGDPPSNWGEKKEKKEKKIHPNSPGFEFFALGASNSVIRSRPKAFWWKWGASGMSHTSLNWESPKDARRSSKKFSCTGGLLYKGPGAATKLITVYYNQLRDLTIFGPELSTLQLTSAEHQSLAKSIAEILCNCFQSCAVRRT